MAINWPGFQNWAIARLKEPNTWQAIVTAGAFFGLPYVAPEQAANAVSLLVTLFFVAKPDRPAP